MSKWSVLVKGVKKNWKEGMSKKREGGGGGFVNEKVESGKYIARLTQLELSSDGKAIFEHYKITEGECKGEKLRNRQGLDNPTGLGFFMENLEKLGYEVPGADDLEDDLPPILEEINEKKPAVRIKVKTEEYQNIYLDKALSDDEVEDSTEEKEERAPEEDAAEFQIEVGTEVMAEVDGEKIKATVVRIVDDETVKVKDENGDKHTIALEDLGPVEAEEKPSKKGAKESSSDLEDLDREELEELIDEKDLDVNPKKFKDDDDLREAIEEALAGAKEEDPDDEPKKDKVTKKKGSLKK